MVGEKVFIVVANGETKGEIKGAFDTFKKAQEVLEETKSEWRKWYKDDIEQEEIFNDSYALWTFDDYFEVKVIEKVVR